MTTPSNDIFRVDATRPLHEAEWFADWCARRECYAGAVAEMAVPGEAALRRELIFCLLGGHGISFELALSATERVMAMSPFSNKWRSGELLERLTAELRAPQFEPRRKCGEFRRYRFPNRKSGLIVAAREWVLRHGPLTDELLAIRTELERRDWLARCPGLGAKSASWLLRNVGLAQDLAVIDVHVLRAMSEFEDLPPVSLPRDYGLVEDRFLAWCDELGTSAAELDLFLWEWQRAQKHGGRRSRAKDTSSNRSAPPVRREVKKMAPRWPRDLSEPARNGAD